MSSEWEGYRLEHGAVEHTAVLTSGVIDELGLEDLGLAYRTRDVAAIHLFGDGAQRDDRAHRRSHGRVDRVDLRP